MLGSFENAKLLAGGQSLMPMLNMRYVLVDHLIDLNDVKELSDIELSPDLLTVGAMTRQRALLDHDGVLSRAPIFSEALSYVGHIQTRNRGTIGGSLAHMDPAAELLCLAALHDATFVIEGPAGIRDVPISEYMLGYMTPNLAPDELLITIRFKLPRSNHGSSFQEFSQRHGDFALIGVGAILERGDTEEITHARLAMIGAGTGAVRLEEAEKILVGERPSSDLFNAASETVNRLDFMSDALTGEAYRQRLARVLTRRALEQSAERLKGSGA